ncbi:hypothetical protein SADUNF_Sadunf17G0133400 [Salix dunnii]|uniref:HMA domain-containing protein n=1 Tax=Salix dunnii TaxID=1413687 RepID=A0A835MFJ3_9ROSI|nr:hypothetical protein SADUNF_Sadunf17G0133400 [Salix dunnii]
MKTASGFPGVDSISIDMKDKKLTVTGDSIDLVKIVVKLRKLCRTEIITFRPAKEPEKKKMSPRKKSRRSKGIRRRKIQLIILWLITRSIILRYPLPHIIVLVIMILWRVKMPVSFLNLMLKTNIIHIALLTRW